MKAYPAVPAAGPARAGGREPWRVGGGRKPAHVVPIGRPTRWANPFRIGIDGDRERVVELYRAHLLGRPDLIEQLPQLRGLVLWCPGCPAGTGPCHGDVLLELANP